MNHSRYLFLLFCLIFSSAHASIIVFTDFEDWKSSFSNSQLIIEDFEGGASNFLADSVDNQVGTLSINVNGGVGDPGPTGLTGNGYFQSEVDSSGDDELSVSFNFVDSWGFALFGLQNDSLSNISSLALDELAISTGSGNWIVSDIIGKSESALPFLGFASDELIKSFTLFHAAKISDVTRTSEEFYIDRLAIASAGSVALSVAEPPVVSILLMGLVLLWAGRLKVSKSIRN